MTQIFVDMDGVLADFDTGYEAAFGIRPSKANDSVDWSLVRSTDGFYRDLPPMPDFEELWAGLVHLNPIILTGVPSSVSEAADNKRAWVDRVIGRHQPMIGCLSKDKSLHIRNPGDILIDDWEKYRAVWLSRGGRWITHTSAATSLAALGELLDEEGVAMITFRLHYTDGTTLDVDAENPTQARAIAKERRTAIVKKIKVVKEKGDG